MTDVIGAALDHLLAFVAQWWILIALLAVAFSVRWPRIELRLPAIKPLHACAIVFAVALAWIVTPAFVRGLPVPWMHDDYSSLLGGEMVAQGHTSYPPHPMWRHFETPHQLQLPRRASKYLPGQLLVLAAGIRIAGQAIAGEWLITALAAAAICWAAFAWVDASLALLVGLIAAIHPMTLEWGEAYRGGGLAAFAGALAIGATGRLLRGARARDGCLLGIGLALLAITRPYEGAALAIVCGAVVIRRVKPLLVAAAVVIIGMIGIALWNWSVTGKPLVMPYVEYQRQYDAAPLFIFQRPRPQPASLNAEMATIERVYAGQYRRAREHPMVELYGKFADIGKFLFGEPSSGPIARVWPLFLLSFAGLVPLLRRESSARSLALIAGVVIVALLLITGWLLPHYLAPIAAAAWIVLVWSALNIPRQRGTLLIALLFVVNTCGAWWARTSDRGTYWERDRRAIEQSLRADGKRDLILVPSWMFDVVYNHADIDAQDVVWARDLGAAANQPLLRYYSDRVVWRLTRDAGGRLALQREPMKR